MTKRKVKGRRPTREEELVRIQVWKSEDKDKQEEGKCAIGEKKIWDVRIEDR